MTEKKSRIKFKLGTLDYLLRVFCGYVSVCVMDKTKKAD